MDFVETEGWRDIESFDSSEWVRLAAIQALEAAGITVPNLREEHVSQPNSMTKRANKIIGVDDRRPH